MSANDAGADRRLNERRTTPDRRQDSLSAKDAAHPDRRAGERRSSNRRQG